MSGPIMAARRGTRGARAHRDPAVVVHHEAQGPTPRASRKAGAITSAHRHSHSGPERSLDARLWLGVGLNVLITVVEVVGGTASGSLALLSDALHNASDVGSLLLAIAARALGRKAPTGRFSYGFRRFEVLAALVNAAVLVGLAVLIGREAVGRLRHPAAVDGHAMLAVALVAFVANAAAVLLLHRHEAHDLNVRSAFLHLLQDALASLVVVVAAVLSGTKAGPWLDPAVSLLIGVAVVVSAGRLIRASLRILIEAAPSGLDVEAMVSALDEAFAPAHFHHVHAWTVGPGEVVLTAHVKLECESLAEVERLLASIRLLLAERWNIHHATLEPEWEHCSGTGTPDRWKTPG
jgi:cobalt-zinc-cadmium efflux system protein